MSDGCEGQGQEHQEHELAHGTNLASPPGFTQGVSGGWFGAGPRPLAIVIVIVIGAAPPFPFAVVRRVRVAHIVPVMARPRKSLKGQLLLDGGNLQGSSFHRSVVLICQHDDQGAFGLILNRQAGTLVGEALPGEVPEGLRQQPLFLGGPVQPQALSYLVSEPALMPSNVFPDLSLGHNLEELIALGKEGSLTRRFLVFAGYAGWAPGQLDDEMRRESWLTHPASLSLVFDPLPQNLWKKIMSRKGWQNRLIAGGPDNPALN